MSYFCGLYVLYLKMCKCFLYRLLFLEIGQDRVFGVLSEFNQILKYKNKLLMKIIVVISNDVKVFFMVFER